MNTQHELACNRCAAASMRASAAGGSRPQRPVIMPVRCIGCAMSQLAGSSITAELPLAEASKPVRKHAQPPQRGAQHCLLLPLPCIVYISIAYISSGHGAVLRGVGAAQVRRLPLLPRPSSTSPHNNARCCLLACTREGSGRTAPPSRSWRPPPPGHPASQLLVSARKQPALPALPALPWPSQCPALPVTGYAPCLRAWRPEGEVRARAQGGGAAPRVLI